MYSTKVEDILEIILWIPFWSIEIWFKTGSLSNCQVFCVSFWHFDSSNVCKNKKKQKKYNHNNYHLVWKESKIVNAINSRHFNCEKQRPSKKLKNIV
jgi:hypothetical protein